MPPDALTLCGLILSIATIVLLTSVWRVNAFFALLIAAIVFALFIRMPPEIFLDTVKSGFGNMMRSLGLLIVFGTTLGVLLEHSGATRVMADAILRVTGRKKSSLAMSITGLTVGLPIFCDSGYMVLSGMNRSLAAKSGTPLAVMAGSLATGLYAVHCMVPPHPGAAAAAGIIGVETGRLIAFGIPAAIPVMLTGYAWAKFAGKKAKIVDEDNQAEKEAPHHPGTMVSFLPVIIPVVLIGLGSFLTHPVLRFLGRPETALAAGILFAMPLCRKSTGATLSNILQGGLEKAGMILLIICAGGAFGAVLATADLGLLFSRALPLSTLGLFFPFLIAALLKTAQGSSTVAVLTAATLVQPLLPALQIETLDQQLLCVLAMGAGSMMVSHANDSYFWVISKFSGLDTRTMLRVYSLGTLWMGMAGMGVVYLISKVV